VLSVFLREGHKILGNLANRVDRRRLTNGDASAAINAIHRVDEELRNLGKIWLIFTGMNAVNRADFNAFLIFRATFDDNESHESFLLKYVRGLSSYTQNARDCATHPRDRAYDTRK
jgi:hypothetical protein